MAMDDNDDRNDADRLREIGVIISIRTIVLLVVTSCAPTMNQQTPMKSRNAEG
jgi:hypothetical protein